MAESFLLLLAAGVMLATAVPNPKDLTLNWLRLGGILSLSLVAVASYFTWNRTPWRSAAESTAIVTIPILAHLAVVQLNRPYVARMLVAFAFLSALGAGQLVWRPPPGKTSAVQELSILATSAGVAAMTGSVL